MIFNTVSGLNILQNDILSRNDNRRSTENVMIVISRDMKKGFRSLEIFECVGENIFIFK